MLPPRSEIEEDKVTVQLEKIERSAERKHGGERGGERADESERGERAVVEAAAAVAGVQRVSSCQKQKRQ